MRKVFNPIHFEELKWYFWDETWAFRYGPFSCYRSARRALVRYAVEVLGE